MKTILFLLLPIFLHAQRLDTIPARLLTSKVGQSCHDVMGFAVGHMVSGKWSTHHYLDINKRPIDISVTVWDAKVVLPAAKNKKRNNGRLFPQQGAD